MTISGKYFPTQVSGERVFLLVRRHWFYMAMMGLLVSTLFVPIIILVIYWFSNPATFSGIIGNFVIIFAGMYLLTVLGLMLYGFVNYYLDVYIVTNERIVDIKQNGFFRREIAELHLRQIQDVEAKVEGLFKTLMHFGTINIQTAGERGNFIFEDVPHPYTLAKKIVELQRLQIEKIKEKTVIDGTHSHEHLGTKSDSDHDDYWPEDFAADNKQEVASEINIKKFEHEEESDGGIKYFEESYSADNEEKLDQSIIEDEYTMAKDYTQPVEEFGFGADDRTEEEKYNQKLSEMSEGEEIKLDDEDRRL